MITRDRHRSSTELPDNLCCCPWQFSFVPGPRHAPLATHLLSVKRCSQMGVIWAQAVDGVRLAR
jgi:hypothetical protein